MNDALLITAGISITILVWIGARTLYRRWRHPLVNPVFLSVVCIIGLLLASRIDYFTYAKGGGLLTFLLKPAVVAFAVPLFRQRARVMANLRPVVVGVVIGCFTGILTAVGLALAFGAPAEVARTLAPKSVTSPIALELSQRTGGIGALTAGIVIATGIFGAMIGPEFLRRCGVKGRFAIGLAVGTASHGIGVARMEEEDRGKSDLGKAAGIIGMTLNGLATALVLSVLLKLLL